MGITAQSWADDIESGEIVVLALLPVHEGKGLKRRLLALVTDHLRSVGHSTLFLGCAADPSHPGWRSRGSIDRYGNEVLELQAP